MIRGLRRSDGPTATNNRPVCEPTKVPTANPTATATKVPTGQPTANATKVATANP